MKNYQRISEPFPSPCFQMVENKGGEGSRPLKSSRYIANTSKKFRPAVLDPVWVDLAVDFFYL